MPGQPALRLPTAALAKAALPKAALPKATRLCGPAAFKAVMSKPPVAKSQHLVLHALVREGAELAQIGAVLPKRWAKRAVTRNAIRRQIMAWFEALRQTRPDWSECRSVVVRLRSNFHGSAAKISKKLKTAEPPAAQSPIPPQATSRALKRAVQAELQGFTCALR